jgi:hypothetical protein
VLAPLIFADATRSDDTVYTADTEHEGVDDTEEAGTKGQRAPEAPEDMAAEGGEA